MTTRRLCYDLEMIKQNRERGIETIFDQLCRGLMNENDWPDFQQASSLFGVLLLLLILFDKVCRVNIEEDLDVT